MHREIINLCDIYDIFVKPQLGCHPVAVVSSPVTGLEWPRGIQEIKVPRFHGKFGKVVRLTHQPPLPPGDTPGTHFC